MLNKDRHPCVRDSPEVTVFCAISKNRVHGPYFIEDNVTVGDICLVMLQSWLMDRLAANEDEDFIFAAKRCSTPLEVVCSRLLE